MGVITYPCWDWSWLIAPCAAYMRRWTGRHWFRLWLVACVRLQNSVTWGRTPTLWIEAHIFSCDQTALWMVQSVCLSVCLSATPFSSCSCHRIIMKLLPLTEVMSMRKVKVRGRRSRSQRSWPHLSLFRTVTPVWIHIWQWNDAQSLIMLRRGVLLFLKVIRQISRSHGSKNRRIWPKLGVSGL